ncbi:hypothetical protein Tsubulata_033620, partial [Turnera subulata]
MEVLEQVLHMKGGEGEYSYYKNSLFQKYVILKTRPILEEAVTKLCLESLTEDCFKMADMGCSSGPNTLLPLWEIMETIDSTCRTLNQKAPALQCFLNDLPGTDFNTIFRSRALEVISGGRMVLTFMGSSDHHPACKYGAEIWIAIGDCLKDLTDERCLCRAVDRIVFAPPVTPLLAVVPSLQ